MFPLTRPSHADNVHLSTSIFTDCKVFDFLFFSFPHVSFLLNFRYDIDSKSPDLAKHVSELGNASYISLN